MLFVLLKSGDKMQSNIEILYQDKNIVACIKPVGYSSEDSDCFKSMVKVLREQLNVKEIFTLHRLDVSVGGVMVYALNKNAASKMSSLIAAGKLKKEYEAIVYGIPAQKEGIMEDLLFKDSKKNKTFVVDKERKGVKKARLFYNVIETFELNGKTVSKVHIVLDTGRSHQIRAQFAYRKMPLVGDGKYGAKDNEKNIALCSTRISFSSPFSCTYFCFENNKTQTLN